jgi:F-type H+-transporting ATPase subunit b
MLIDWFTVIAQMVNFLVLVWLLKRFLYKPVLKLIDAREKRIAHQLADASNKETEAQKLLEKLHLKNEMFEGQRDALLSQAVKDAHAERQKLLDEARKEADQLRTRRQEMLRNEQCSLDREITRRTQKEVFAIARKALTELAGTGLEERMAEVFVRRLRELDGEAKSLLASAFKSSSRPAIVRSTFELAPAQREAIEAAIREAFVLADSHLQFETSPDLVSGIELSADGQKVAWSIGDYLASLEKSIGRALESKAAAEQGSDQHAA